MSLFVSRGDVVAVSLSDARLLHGASDCAAAPPSTRAAVADAEVALFMSHGFNGYDDAVLVDDTLRVTSVTWAWPTVGARTLVPLVKAGTPVFARDVRSAGTAQFVLLGVVDAAFLPVAAHEVARAATAVAPRLRLTVLPLRPVGIPEGSSGLRVPRAVEQGKTLGNNHRAALDWLGVRERGAATRSVRSGVVRIASKAAEMDAAEAADTLRAIAACAAIQCGSRDAARVLGLV
jgi:hypothetical protein